MKSERDPPYWEILSDVDREGYHDLRNRLAMNRSDGRDGSTDSFESVLRAVRTFSERNDENDWKRFLVCGVCWMDRAIAVNTRQLRLLVSKCKSSINGSLKKMGYSTNTAHSESWKILFPRIPRLQNHFTELRQWTIRYQNAQAPQPVRMAATKTSSQVHFPCPLKFKDKIQALVHCS